MQHHSHGLPALPIPPEEPMTSCHSTPVTGLIPSGFAYASDAIALGLDQTFSLLLLIPHAMHIIKTFQVCFRVLSASWSRLTDLASTLSRKHWCAPPRLISSEPSFIPFPLQIYFKAFLMNKLLCEYAFPSLRQGYPVCCQQAGCCVDRPMIKNPKILLVTSGSEPGIDLLTLPISSLIIPCNWKDSREHYLCSWSLNQSSQGPEVNCPWTSYCNFIAAYMKKING